MGLALWCFGLGIEEFLECRFLSVEGFGVIKKVFGAFEARRPKPWKPDPTHPEHDLKLS